MLWETQNQHVYNMINVERWSLSSEMLSKWIKFRASTKSVDKAKQICGYEGQSNLECHDTSTKLFWSGNLEQRPSYSTHTWKYTVLDNSLGMTCVYVNFEITKKDVLRQGNNKMNIYNSYPFVARHHGHHVHQGVTREK